MKKLPIGIQNLREIREGGYYYVDKSPFVKELADGGKYYFLSRPRRFGKSLFLDTLKEAFSGNKKLFMGLFLEKNWDWPKKYPVIRISFGSGGGMSRSDLEQIIFEQLQEQFSPQGFSPKNKTISGVFREYVKWLSQALGPAVILIDEYDKPILDKLSNQDKALEMRDGLRSFYAVIKESDPYLKMVFFTGVSKFSKVSLFSGLNNLEDITLSPGFATICGYSQAEFETVFSDLLPEISLPGVKKWYNGYNFLGDLVYNPFDVLLFLKNREFRNYWFETGTPTFLVDLLREHRFFIPDLENLSASETLLSSFDVGSIAPETLMFQTGYLTIQKVRQTCGGRMFSLVYPNHEVRTSLNDHILQYLTHSSPGTASRKICCEDALMEGNVEELEGIFFSLFASIPHDWYRKNRLSEYEGYYASIFYSFFRAIGLDLIPEDVTNHGRIDLTVKVEKYLYLFEFKVKGLAKGRSRALTQLRKKNYHEKYLDPGKKIFLIGVEFDTETRNITALAWEEVSQAGKTTASRATGKK